MVSMVVLCILFVGSVLSSPLESFDDISEYSIGPTPVPPEFREALIAMQPVNETETRNRPLDSPRSCDCGVKGVTTRILGGTVVKGPEWPWQAYILLDDGGVCGGSLISHNWVVTAAHCLEGMKKVMIYLGITNVKDPTTAKHITQASAIISHEDFKLRADKSAVFDIALLELKTPVRAFNKYIKPICLPYKFADRDFQGQKATVIGWGDVNNEGDTSSRLRQINVTVINNEICSNPPFSYVPHTIPNDMLCAFRNGGGSCHGDSGGPLNWVSRVNSRTYLIGIVSYGKKCGFREYPGVYTKTTSFLTWINDNAGQLFCIR